MTLRVIKTKGPTGLLNHSSGMVYEFLRNSWAAFAALRALRSAPDLLAPAGRQSLALVGGLSGPLSRAGWLRDGGGGPG